MFQSLDFSKSHCRESVRREHAFAVPSLRIGTRETRRLAYNAGSRRATFLLTLGVLLTREH
jgi:hypothetical protein